MNIFLGQDVIFDNYTRNWHYTIVIGSRYVYCYFLIFQNINLKIIDTADDEDVFPNNDIVIEYAGAVIHKSTGTLLMFSASNPATMLKGSLEIFNQLYKNISSIW